MTEEEMKSRRRSRNMVLGLALFALVALFYGMTIVRFGAHH